jgi:hypothetical protein
MSKKPPAPVADRPIHRDDIARSVRNIQEEVEAVKESTVGLVVAAGLGIALLLVLFAFVIGKRRGKKRYSFVEIRRA